MSNDVGDDLTFDPLGNPMDYYRQKALELQTLAVGLDSVYIALQDTGAALQTIPGSDELYAEFLDLVNEFESRKSLITGAAQGINIASQGLNAIGIPFPTIQTGLAGFPFVALGATIAAALVAIEWGKAWIARNRALAINAQNLAAVMTLPESQRTAALEAFLRSKAAAEAAGGGSGETSIASLAKWALILGAAYLAYRVWEGQR